MSTSWKYDCSGPSPEWIANSDITGTGVAFSYIITAGIVVVVLALYYFVAYDPSHDPFQGSRRNSVPRAFYPNPIDALILEDSRRIAMTCLGAFGCISINNTSFEEAFIRLLTGYSILISGLSQLGSGLQTFYWQVVIGLTWFSTITHLSCLTALRNHLYLHSSERTWRLAAMTTLCVHLPIGLGTGRDEPNYGDAAICYIRIRSPLGQAFYTMLFSVLLTTFSVVVRIAMLYRFLSADISTSTIPLASPPPNPRAAATFFPKLFFCFWLWGGWDGS
ncbi:hypothetical protein BO83DRAFT_399702 [Aspergillus eucalypticola CBS 122712]|uniref:Uncharacterized protein n=1 Tax=Aspergillus eucalypticola (strain CBS 122712 / IBT 29274) TaxID=1448314 RepID=A0A317V923_ASPEC|nr:uncharacterized protein BO83DRAFT_399702 [Aspergillus eucalypticola CBS 122712]PWY70545.1 hypothetical protein BO83DRAFT_399702 [Aspergillus eucalypticola CBS 122712]